MKTFAFIDVIGVKEALSSSRAEGEALLRKFWIAMDTFVNNPQDDRICSKAGESTLTSVDVCATVFSDSALIDVLPEIEPRDFYLKILRSLRQHLDRQQIRFYCIVSRGDYLPQPTSPSLGSLNLGSEHTGRTLWNPAAGCGDAWRNIFDADKMIHKHKNWHSKYSLYAIGAESLLPALKQEEVEIVSDTGVIPLYPCKWPD